jgi:hypothetical protein
MWLYFYLTQGKGFVKAPGVVDDVAGGGSGWFSQDLIGRDWRIGSLTTRSRGSVLVKKSKLDENSKMNHVFLPLLL